MFICYRACLAVLCVLALAETATARTSAKPLPALVIPAGTTVSVHVLAPIVSNVAVTGQSFAFEALSDAVIDGQVVVRKGATGSGTVAFAGAAGGHGHEGNLHLVFTQVASTFGAPLALNVESDFDGHKQRMIGLLSGATWVTGFGAAVRGGQAVVTVDQTIPLTLAHDVCVSAANRAACPAAP